MRLEHLGCALAALAACGEMPRAGNDAGATVDAPACTSIGTSCVGEVMRACASIGEPIVDTACAWGCADDGVNARCVTLVPTGGGVDATDLASAAQLPPFVISSYALFDTTTGRIVGGVTREAGEGVRDGIGFVRRNRVGVFTFGSLEVEGPVVFDGTDAAAFVAAGAIRIAHRIDARGSCRPGQPGPGGFAGGNEPLARGGSPADASAGGAASAGLTSGGGGGGHGGQGGAGGASIDAVPAPGGSSFGDAEISSLVGGAGGGAGSSGTRFARGGGGGGAVQLVSDTSILIEGAINAGGCGGEGGGPGTTGGGGGAGGTVLLEAPVIEVRGTISVNGGGGGGGRYGTAGENGDLGRQPAAGGVGGFDEPQGYGGSGAAGAAPANAGELSEFPGGGGGAIGRIRMNTRDDARLDIHVLATLSPAFDDPATTCTRGRTTTR